MSISRMAKQPRIKVVTKRRLQFLSESDSGQSDDESDDDNVLSVNKRRSVPVVESIETLCKGICTKRNAT